MSLDFNNMPTLKLTAPQPNEELKNGFDATRAFVFNDRYFYYDTYYEADSENKKRIIYVFDMRFNSLYASYNIGLLLEELGEETSISKFRFLPYDLKTGLLYNHTYIQKIKFDSDLQKVSIPTPLQPLPFNSSRVFEAQLYQNHLLIGSANVNEEFNTLYLFDWNQIDKIVAKVELPPVVFRFKDIRTFIRPLDADKFLLIDFESTFPDLLMTKFEPSVYHWNINEDAPSSLTKIETSGITEWPEGKDIFLQGAWRDHLFFCTMHKHVDNVKRKQTHFYVFNLLTKKWSEFATVFNGMLSLAQSLNANSNYPLIICSCTVRNLETVTKEEDQFFILSDFYRLPVKQPDQLEILCQRAALRYGLFEKQKTETQIMKIEELDNSEENEKIDYVVKSLKHDANFDLPEHLKPKKSRIGK